jgi:DNA repair protein RecN (Recombination protein N)
MLQEINISNYAIIDKLTVSLGSGMNVFTGETGAGKSIILDALNLLCGGKFERASMRDPEKPLKVEALFICPDNQELTYELEQLGIEMEDGELLIRREVHPSGKNRCFCNGQLMRVSDLKDIAGSFVNIHSQHDTHQLLQVKSHELFFERFAGNEFQETLQQYRELFKEYRQTMDEQRKREQRLSEIASEKCRLEEDLEEIGAAELYAEEEYDLTRQHSILVHHKEIEERLNVIRGIMGRDVEQGVFDGLSTVRNELSKLADLTPDAVNLLSSFDEIFYTFEEYSAELVEFESTLESGDERELERVEERLSVLEHLKRKYGGELSHVLEYEKQGAERLFQLNQEEEKFQNMDTVLRDYRIKLVKQAKELEKLRNEIAPVLQTNVEETLFALAMENARFQIRLESKNLPEAFELDGENYHLGMDGFHSVEFYLQSNLGQEFQPLSKVASGGEISRVMLALKKVFARVHPAGTFVFDEIDTGVGGDTAHRIAEVLQQISKEKQSIVITHLAQVAMVADSHFFVEKAVEEERTVSKVSSLSSDEREKELVRMMGMDENSGAMQLVREMKESLNS